MERTAMVAAMVAARVGGVMIRMIRMVTMKMVTPDHPAQVCQVQQFQRTEQNGSDLPLQNPSLSLLNCCVRLRSLSFHWFKTLLRALRFNFPSFSKSPT